MTNTSTFRNTTAICEPFAARIAASHVSAVGVLLAVADTLIEAKEALPRGAFQSFLRDVRVAIKPRLAQLYMTLGRAPDREQLAACGIAKATLLLMVSLQQRAALMAQHDVKAMSARRLRTLLAQGPRVRAARGRRTPDGDSYARGFAYGRRRGFEEAQRSTTGVARAAGMLHLSVAELSHEAVDAAFRALIQIFHPDHNIVADGQFARDLIEARDLLRAYLKRAKAA